MELPIIVVVCEERVKVVPISADHFDGSDIVEMGKQFAAWLSRNTSGMFTDGMKDYWDKREQAT